MRILITGGAGFIGSNLCNKLLQKNNEVICLDNFFTGSRDNILHLIDNINFELIQADVTSFLNYEVDQIYNLACPASPVNYQYDPVNTVKINVMGAINVLDLAKKVNARVFQASTSEVYGDPQVHPQVESYWGSVNPIGPRSCYDEGKRCAETLFFDFHRQYKLQIKIARIFNTYGPNMQQDDGRVVSNFIVQALKNNDITIYGDGSQTRSFCYVDDLTEAILKFMHTDSNITGPVNLGNPDEVTILEIANKIIELTGSSSSIIFKELPVDDPKMRKPDINYAKSILDWEPKINLERGLNKTISYFDNILTIE